MKTLLSILDLIVTIIAGILEFLIPHFVTEQVAVLLHEEEDGELDIEPVCPVEWITDDDDFHAVVTIRSFAWLFWSFFGRAETETILLNPEYAKQFEHLFSRD